MLQSEDSKWAPNQSKGLSCRDLDLVVDEELLALLLFLVDFEDDDDEDE